MSLKQIIEGIDASEERKEPFGNSEVYVPEKEQNALFCEQYLESPVMSQNVNQYVCGTLTYWSHARDDD